MTESTWRPGSLSGKQRLTDALRGVTAAAMRMLPRLRGYGRISAAVNAAFLRAGAPPLVTGKMNQGHRLVLDVRVPAQAWALFTGDYETAKVSILCALMRQDSVCLDVGASIGFYTVPLGRTARKIGGRVIAFEPFAANYVRIGQNLDLNNIAAVVDLRMLGLSSAAGSAELTLREDFSSGGEVGNASILIPDGEDEQWKRVQISLSSLDDLWPALGQDRLDLVKVDIEGHEDQFFSGARATLRRYRPIILTEANRYYYRRRGIVFEAAIASLLPPDYRYFVLTRPSLHWHMYDRVTSLRRLDDLSQGGDQDDIFLTPVERVEELHRGAQAARRAAKWRASF